MWVPVLIRSEQVNIAFCKSVCAVAECLSPNAEGAHTLVEAIFKTLDDRRATTEPIDTLLLFRLLRL